LLSPEKSSDLKRGGTPGHLWEQAPDKRGHKKNYRSGNRAENTNSDRQGNETPRRGVAKPARELKEGGV